MLSKKCRYWPPTYIHIILYHPPPLFTLSPTLFEHFTRCGFCWPRPDSGLTTTITSMYNNHITPNHSPLLIILPPPFWVLYSSGILLTMSLKWCDHNRYLYVQWAYHLQLPTAIIYTPHLFRVLYSLWILLTNALRVVRPHSLLVYIMNIWTQPLTVINYPLSLPFYVL